jgi:general secretion pathway protein I
MSRRRGKGFTLLEVMIGLALLGVALVVLIKSAAGNIFNAQQAHMMGVVTDLARGKMYDLEEMLLKDGFSDTEQAEDGKTFDDEGWPSIQYSYKIEEVELPSFDQLQELAKGKGKGSGSGSDGENSFESSALGGMMAQFGGFGGGGGAGSGSDAAAAAGASLIQGQYSMFQQILKVTVRKVTLVVKWQVMGSERDMKVVTFITDAGSMDKVLNGLGAEPPGGSNGSDVTKPPVKPEPPK